MGIQGRLDYDPTDANSIAASHTVGSYVLAGDDGTAIGHVSDALKVDIGSVSDLDIRDLTHVSDSVKVGDGTDFLAIAADGSIAVTDNGTTLSIDDGAGSLTVDASQLDIDDLNATDDAVQAWCFDGSGNAIGSTAGALDINIASGDVDDSLANTAIENTSTAVSTSAVAVVSSALANRKWLYLANEGNVKLYVGKSGVTTSNGYPMYKNEKLELRIGATPVVQAIGDTGASSEDLRVMELS